MNRGWIVLIAVAIVGLVAAGLLRRRAVLVREEDEAPYDKAA